MNENRRALGMGSQTNRSKDGERVRIERGPVEHDHSMPSVRVLRDGSTVVLYPQRQRVFELWRDEEGRQMGRWHWEYL